MGNRKRILVADDDPDLLSLLEMVLLREGYEVVLAADGKDALQKALADSFDVILLDVMMPYIDGYHVAYEVTNKLGAKSPQIIIMTSRDTVREKGVALMSGAEELFQKPFDMAALRSRLAAIFANGKSDA
jgi:DNA-binding response OmpR family regulator